jgi:O-antigen/teichoic acid export membrane protein
LQRYPAKTGARTGLLLVRAAATVVILRAGGGLVGLITTFLGLSLVEHALMAGLCWWYLPGLRLGPRFVNVETFRMIRGYSLDAFLAMIAGRIAFQTDALVIGAFLAPEFIAYFAIGAKLADYAKNVLGSLTTVLTPAVSQLQARTDDEKIKQVFLDGSRIATWFFTPIVVGFLTLGRPFISLWVGRPYAEESYPILVILSLTLVLMPWQGVSVRILYGVGRLRRFTRLALTQATANLVLSLMLVQPFGIRGVAWGTTIPFVIFSCVNIADVSHFCRVRPREAFRRILLKPVALALVLGGAWVSLVEFGIVSSFATFFLVGAVGTLPFAVAALCFELGPRSIVQRLGLAQQDTSSTEIEARPGRGAGIACDV